MTPRLPVSDDEDFEVADYEMMSESSDSNGGDQSSDEDFVVEVRQGDIHRNNGLFDRKIFDWKDLRLLNRCSFRFERVLIR